MGDDDDEDCQHVFSLEQVLIDATGARLEHRCRECGTVSYEASRTDVDRPDRGGLTGT